MVTAKLYNSGFLDGQTYKVDGLVNRGEWFNETWFIGIGCGHDMLRLVVEGDTYQDCVDAIADHPKWAEWLRIEDTDDLDPDFTIYAGNEGVPVNLDNVRVACPCYVNYFAPKDTDCR